MATKYRFYDTTDLTLPLEDLPSEALCINGQYIEKQVPGYHTLYTTGREGNTREVSSSETSGRDGARFRSVRRQPREIRVGFQMESRNAKDYTDKFNALKKIVREKEARLIFHDEPDKYFTGTLTDIEVNDTGELCVRGELVFFCADPFKYAVREKTITANTVNGRAVFEIEYQGTVEAFPSINTVTRSNTETLLFSDDAGNMVAVGTPDATTSNLSRGSRILTANPGSLLSAVYPGSITRDEGEDTIMMPVRTPDGTQTIVTVGGTSYLSLAKVDAAYPGGNGMADVDEDDEEEEEETTVDTSSVTGFTCLKAVSQTSGTNYICRVQPLFYADDFRETGYLHFGLVNATQDTQDDTVYEETEEAEIILEKTGIGSPYATAYFCIFGEVVKKIRFRADADNPVAGPNGYGIGITRFGNVYTFLLGEDQYEIDATSLLTGNAASIPMSTHAIFSAARVLGQKQMAGMGFASARIIATTRTSADSIIEIMRSTDNVSVDCSTGTIRINGQINPDLGSVDNRWTEFSLKPGFNRIECSATTAEDNGAKPESYTLTYREAWE